MPFYIKAHGSKKRLKCKTIMWLYSTAITECF